MTILIIAILILCLLAYLELSHRIRPNSPLKLNLKEWDVRIEDNIVKIAGWVEIHNPHKRMEVMVPSLNIKPILLGNNKAKEVNISTSMTPHHKDQKSREDDYWSAYIVKSNDSTDIHISIIIKASSFIQFNEFLQCIWLDIKWVNYGPFGVIDRNDGFVIPISNINQATNNHQWKDTVNGTKLLPIKTHILGILDNPFDILFNYVASVSKPGDILTIGETPLAVMQGRYVIPSNINVSLLARLLCLPFHPTSSLATGCGMQSLIDLEGPTKVLIAWVIGAFLKTIGVKGFFYRLAGSQARLIDDITGTTPPYDQTIVLGPIDTEDFCRISSKNLGIEVAIVDVNDLGRVKVLSCSKNCNKKLVHDSLISNPAGNANQHTPLVLIRPS